LETEASEPQVQNQLGYITKLTQKKLHGKYVRMDTHQATKNPQQSSKKSLNDYLTTVQVILKLVTKVFLEK
jgi:hypothetical protein